MSNRERPFAMPSALPSWLRAVMIALTTIILCSCRSPQTASTDPFQDRDGRTMLAAAPGSEPAATSGPAAADRAVVPQESNPVDYGGAASNESGVVLASATAPLVSKMLHPHGPTATPDDVCWYPTGSAVEYKLPPSDEVLCDGGDDGLPAGVRRDGTVVGLEMTDAVAHYRTPDGQMVLVPTNDVCIYAPRFGAVRQVTGANVNIRTRGVEGMAGDLTLVGTESRFEPSTTKQHLEPAASAADRPSSLLRTRQQMGGLENEDGVDRIYGRELAELHEQSIRFVLLDNRDQPLELGGMLNAIHWTHDLGVQVAIDSRRAQVIKGTQQAAFLYHLEEPNEPRFKVVKLADRTAARPGEIVRFMLRYENVGNVPISELVLTDNLTTRLEYVEDSHQSDRPAAFATEMNAGGSLVLRWELGEPLDPGEIGVIQFATRVR